MKTIIKQLSLCALLLCVAVATRAQQSITSSRVLVAPSVDFFVPHWQVDLQGGGAYDLGEGKFVDLLSPAVQLSTTYQFHPFMGVRLGVSGAWARNRYEKPLYEYKWNFVQPALDFKLDLLSLFAGWNPPRVANLYMILGAGATYAFNNDEAVEASHHPDVHLRKLWEKDRWSAVGRGGLGTDIRLSERLALSAEVNANILSDHFNSKEGKGDNSDWHFNGLLGLKVNLGRTHGQTDPVYRIIEQRPVEEPQIVPVEEPQGLTVNIFFDLNRSELRRSEFEKLVLLAIYLHEHPHASVDLTGYADKETGNSAINEQLSIRRAQAVADFLIGRGIESARIRKDAKGDREQPFDVPEQNRVTISVVSE